MTYRCGKCGTIRRGAWAARCACGGWIETSSADEPNPEPLSPTAIPPMGVELPVPASYAAIAAPAILSRPVPLSSVDCSDDHLRVTSGIPAVDRVLGGGLVIGSLIVLGGDPGVGKSTLLAQILAGAAAERVLYVTGEESIAQAAMRARRVGCIRDHVYIVAERNLETILAHARAIGPKILAIDSIQTTVSSTVDSHAGSPAQVKHATEAIMAYAKATGTTTILIGHVTKDGALAGPKTLEHLVDVVLHMWIDSDAPAAFRYLGCSSNKNRFGPTHLVATFEFLERGLVALAEPKDEPEPEPDDHQDREPRRDEIDADLAYQA